MFHSFDIVVDNTLIQAKQSKKVRQKSMPARDISRDRFTGRGQDQAAIFLILEQAFRVEPLHHVCDASLRDFETGGDIDHTGIALRIDQLENAFKVIFDRGGTTNN